MSELRPQQQSSSRTVCNATTCQTHRFLTRSKGSFPTWKCSLGVHVVRAGHSERERVGFRDRLSRLWSPSKELTSQTRFPRHGIQGHRAD